MLPFRSFRPQIAPAILSISLLFGIVCGAAGGDRKRPKPKEDEVTATPTPSPTAPGDLTGIPLPVGHEAKGLILPDFDENGHLRARMEAATAKRLDLQQMALNGLKMNTFTEEEKPDLHIEMSTSTLNLKTRVISSKERTTVTRSDFTIAGDTLEFDTVKRQGKFVGKVKMVINDVSQFTRKDGE